MSKPLFHAVNTLAFLVGLCLFLVGGYPFVRSALSDEWPVADGVIRRSEVVPSGPDLFGLALSHHVEIRYDFSSGPRAHRAKRVNFGIGSHHFFLSAFAQRLVDRYPVGKAVRVYYNPDRPADAVLERVPSLGSSVFWMVMGVFLMGVGVLVKFQDTLDLFIDDRR